jgi:hypothetical protein
MRQSGSLVRQAGEAHAGAPAAEQDRLPTTPIIDYTHVFANEAQPEPRR